MFSHFSTNPFENIKFSLGAKQKTVFFCRRFYKEKSNFRNLRRSFVDLQIFKKS